MAAMARRRRSLLLAVERRSDSAVAEVRDMTTSRPMRFASTSMHPSHVLRVATYNIHKGVRGVGPRKRLEIHNLALGIEALDTDLVFLQEVRRMNRAAARHFPDTHGGWPRIPQADYLAPEGYEVAYHTNAVTRNGEHGN